MDEHIETKLERKKRLKIEAQRRRRALSRSSQSGTAPSDASSSSRSPQAKPEPSAKPSTTPPKRKHDKWAKGREAKARRAHQIEQLGKVTKRVIASVGAATEAYSEAGPLQAPPEALATPMERIVARRMAKQLGLLESAEEREEHAHGPIDRVEGGLFAPGKSANPNGRPRGLRDRLTKKVTRDILKSWRDNGPDAIQATLEEDPVAYTRIVVSLLPKEFEDKTPPPVQLTDEQIHDRLRSLYEQLKAFAPGGGRIIEGTVNDTEGDGGALLPAARPDAEE